MDARGSETGQPLWVKATASGTGNCVELARTGTGVLVRDSKNPDGPQLAVSLPAFAGLLSAARAGEFDILR